MSAAEVVALAEVADPALEIEGLRAALEAERKVAAEYRRALEAIRDLAQETAHALPDRPTVKHNAAVGPLLTLSGLAETALES